MYKIIILVFVCLMLAGCLTTRANKQIDETKTLLEQIDPATGKHYTPDKIKEIKQIDENDSILDKLLSQPVIILFVITAIGLLIFGAVSVYRGNIAGAVACGSGAVAVVALPIIIIVMFKAMMFLLYIFCGLVVVGLICGLYWLYLKHKKQASELIDTVDEFKTAYPDEWAAWNEGNNK